MRDLDKRAAELRQRLSRDDAPHIKARADHIEVLVWEEHFAQTVQGEAEDLGIPRQVLRLTRPMPFLLPYPAQGEPNEAALEEFRAKNIKTDSHGNSFLLTSMPPAIGEGSRVLVLGSMPGAVSLGSFRYYAHPRNRFWPVIEQILGVSAKATYEERLRGLLTKNVGLWDVLKHCSRVGSLDARIVSQTEVPNDFEDFLQEHHSITRLVFNGQKAARSFSRLVQPTLSRSIKGRLAMIVAPSTSPANAASGLSALVGAWRQALVIG